MRIPPFIVAGDSATWSDLPFADNTGAPVDATAYTLSYSLRGPVATGLDLNGTAQGTGWVFAISPSQSATLNATASPATWFWQAYATKSGARITAGDGQIVVKPNLAALAGGTFDGRSQAEQILSTVESAILARTNGDMVTEYTIGSRSLKKEPMTELLKLRDRYRTIVSRQRKAQQIANGLGNPTRLGVRFK